MDVFLVGRICFVFEDVGGLAVGRGEGSGDGTVELVGVFVMVFFFDLCSCGEKGFGSFHIRRISVITGHSMRLSE